MLESINMQYVGNLVIVLFMFACLFKGVRADLKRSVSGCHIGKNNCNLG
jgi:hypothetical protein